MDDLINENERRAFLPESDEDKIIRLKGEVTTCKTQIRTLSVESSVLEGIRVAADYLYWQLHNVKTVTPRWANDNVCEAMRNLDEALGKSKHAVSGRQAEITAEEIHATKFPPDPFASDPDDSIQTEATSYDDKGKCEHTGYFHLNRHSIKICNHCSEPFAAVEKGESNG